MTISVKSIIGKLRGRLLCCSEREWERKHSLDIGSPTNVRRIPISDSHPGLTDTERAQIREKAPHDAIRLLNLQSQPTQTTSPVPSLHSTHTPETWYSPAQERSQPPSRETSLPLLLHNAASANLPVSVPTPPRSAHQGECQPKLRMKSMWDSEKRYSSDSSGMDDIDIEKHHRTNASDDSFVSKGVGKGDGDESFSTLDLDFEGEEKGKGFEARDARGGGEEIVGVESVPIRRAREVTYSRVDGERPRVRM